MPIIAQLRQTNGFLPYGNGRSYGDVCLAASGKLLSCRSLDKFISADWSTGRITVEPGITLGEVLRYSVPKGWFLPVTPGTKFATIGGAIANDVHGKNHHRKGTFGRHVTGFSLLRSDVSEPIWCTRTTNSELFNATVSGLGLTGVIIYAKIQLIRVENDTIWTQNFKFGNIKSFFELSNEHDSLNEYSVAWVDCQARGSNLGRGIYSVGNHAKFGSNTLLPQRPPSLTVPFTPPISLINSLSLFAFNNLYFHLPKATGEMKNTNYDPFFYPLDKIGNWNRIYGRKGFQQYQCVIPERFAEDAVEELLQEISNEGIGSFLGVLKRCGAMDSPGLISFPIEGTSLALDFPETGEKLKKLFNRLDRIVQIAHGRLYPAKDAHIGASFFQESYPQWEDLEKARDPAINSLFWERVSR
jgi:FAD/FMN-containing dehydrogenase